MQTKKLLSLKLILFSVIFIWNIGIFNPCFLGKDNLLAHHLLKFLYSPICHQIFERSFNCNHLQLMVCARCTGIYFGALIISLFNLLPISISISKRFLFYASLPLIIDVLLLNMNVYQYNKMVSFITGNIFGASVFIFIFEILKDYFNNILEE